MKTKFGANGRTIEILDDGTIKLDGEPATPEQVKKATGVNISDDGSVISADRVTGVYMTDD